MSEGWTNWSGSVQCAPRHLASAGSEAEVLDWIARAGREGLELRVTGSGHSHSPLCATDGVLLSLDDWAGIEEVSGRSAWIRAGTTLRDLGAALREHGLALENLGDVDVQALAGAIATGTHGTGAALGNLSSRVTGLRIATASGELLTWRAETDAEALRAGRVSLGALGVVTAVRLSCIPAYRLHERVWRGPVEPLIDEIDHLVAATRHFEFFYFPKHDFAEAKSLEPTHLESTDLPEGERIGWSAEILPSERTQKHFEMEYSVPAEAGPACFAAVRERVRSKHPEVVWPIEYRTVAPDDAFLSPAHGHDTVALSVHQDGRFPYAAFFADVEPIFRDHGGRPHWGKIHSCTAQRLAGLYPAWAAFHERRARLDPAGRFTNEHVRLLFGS